MVVAVSLLSPVLGLICQSVSQDTLAFSRSGCVMVACSLAIVFVNHFLSKDAISHIELAEVIQKLPEGWLENNRHKLSEISDVSRQALEKVDLEELIKNKSALKRQSDAIQSLSSSTFVGAEFAIGIVGTLIWGFGDLPAARVVFIIVIALLYILVFSIFVTYKKL